MSFEFRYLGKKNASAYTGLSTRALDYAKAKGQLQYYRVGRKVLFRKDDLDTFMRRFRVSVCNENT